MFYFGFHFRFRPLSTRNRHYSRLTKAELSPVCLLYVLYRCYNACRQLEDRSAAPTNWSLRINTLNTHEFSEYIFQANNLNTTSLQTAYRRVSFFKDPPVGGFFFINIGHRRETDNCQTQQTTKCLSFRNQSTKSQIGYKGHL